MALVGDCELAVTKGIPELNRPVPRSGDDLTVVGGERNREDITSVADEAAGGLAGGKLPQTQGLIPGSRQSIGTIR